MLMSPHRVLLVEDHEPFRAVLRELLQRRQGVQIVGESADGLDAIRQAEACRPDVVMLDIGLPSLNGIEAADGIRGVAPGAKVIFVTNESSLEVVEHVFRRGAHGYVYKPRIERDMLSVFDAIVRGSRFVSGGLERIAQGDGLSSHRHDVLFWSSETVLVAACSRFVASALQEGKAVMVVLTEEHERSVQRSLQASQVDVALAIRQGRYIPVNVAEMLANVIVDGAPDSERFLEAAGSIVTAAAQRATAARSKVAAVGEGSATIWARGDLGAAIQLEHLVDEIARMYHVDSLCAYPVAARGEMLRAVRALCAEHTCVEIS